MVNISASICVAIIHGDIDAFCASIGQRDNLYLKGCSLWSTRDSFYMVL